MRVIDSPLGPGVERPAAPTSPPRPIPGSYHSSDPKRPPTDEASREAPPLHAATRYPHAKPAARRRADDDNLLRSGLWHADPAEAAPDPHGEKASEWPDYEPIIVTGRTFARASIADGKVELPAKAEGKKWVRHAIPDGPREAPMRPQQPASRAGRPIAVVVVDPFHDRRPRPVPLISKSRPSRRGASAQR